MLWRGMLLLLMSVRPSACLSQAHAHMYRT